MKKCLVYFICFNLVRLNNTVFEDIFLNFIFILISFLNFTFNKNGSSMGSLFRAKFKERLLMISEKNCHSNLVVSFYVIKKLTRSINT